jgi:SAM-dependent methyltransferase
VRITHSSTDFIPFSDDSFDLVFSLGVLHHIPDTGRAMKNCVAKVKPGGYFLVYLYYSLDNRGILYKSLFHLSDVIRNIINKLPSSLKVVVCDIIGYLFYFPLARMSKMLKSLFPSSKFPDKMPLSYYSDKSLHIMKNDALDRFGTPLEQRFSKKEIQQMMESSGLEDIVFSNSSPYWHAIGKKP